mgnify:FL=1
MASTLKINTLTGVSTAGSIAVTGEGNSTTTNLQQGLAKAWMNLNQTGTIALRDSFNISGVVDDGTAVATPSFTNNYASIGFTCCGAGGVSTTRPIIRNDTPTTSTQKCECREESTPAQYDEEHLRLTTFGDLA